MTARDARRHALDYLEAEGWAVYDRRLDYGQPALGHYVIVDPNTGGSQVVRVMTGKRPARSKRMTWDTRREGVCDVLAVVDPHDGTVSLRMPASIREAA